MPGPAITGPKSSWAAHLPNFLRTLIGSAVVLCLLLRPDAGRAAQDPSAQPPAQGAQPQNPPVDSPHVQNPQPSSQVPSENGTFVIRKNVDEVLLHATVVDDKGRIVTDLDKSAFTVY